MAIRIASKPETPSAHSDDPETEASGAGDDQAHAEHPNRDPRRGGCSRPGPNGNPPQTIRLRERRGELAHQRLDLGAGSSASAAARTSRVPTITPSAPAPAAGGGLLGRADPEADRDRHVGVRRRAGDDRLRGRRPAPRARRSCRSPRPCRRSRAPARRSAPAARRAWWAPPAARARCPRASHALSIAGASSSGRSGTISPLAPCVDQRVGEPLDAAGEDQVRVAHHHHRDARGELARRPRARRAASPRRAAPRSRPRGSPGRRPAGPRTARPSSTRSAPPSA